MTIDDLARESGMTARNIRAHQSRGLLPPPEIRARTGFYGPEHVERLRLIRELQDEGFNLAAIQRFLESGEALGFTRAVLAPFTEEEPELIDAGDLERRFGGQFDATAVERAERLGILRSLGPGSWEAPSPTLLFAGEELVTLGVPLRHVLAVAREIDRHTAAIAEEFVRLFVEDVIERHPGEWSTIAEALAKMRPLADEAVTAAFRQRMTRAVEDAVGR